jgi:hypothetical protein
MKTSEKILLTAELNTGLNIQVSHTQEVVSRVLYGWKPKTKIVNCYYVKWQAAGASSWTTVGEYTTLNKAMKHFHQMQKTAAKEMTKFIHNDNQRRREGLYSPQPEGDQGILW